MRLPKNIESQFLARFVELIAEGKSLVDSIDVIPPHERGGVFVTYTTYNWDPQRLARWKTNCLTLLTPFAAKGSHAHDQIDVITNTGGKKHQVEYSLGIVEALRDDFSKGFLDDLTLRIEAEL